MSNTNWWQENSGPSGSRQDPDGPPPPPPGGSQVNARWEWPAPDGHGGDVQPQWRGGPSSAGPHPNGSTPVTGPISALMVAFENITNYRGRATRPEFWWLWGTMFLINMLVGFTIEWLWQSGNLSTDGAEVVSFMVLVVSAAVGLPAGVRRMHDSNRSGLWVVVPLVNFILSFMPSDPDVNRFGPPRQFNGMPGPR